MATSLKMAIKWQKHVGGSPITELRQNNIENLLLLIFLILWCGQIFVFCVCRTLPSIGGTRTF